MSSAGSTASCSCRKHRRAARKPRRCKTPRRRRWPARSRRARRGSPRRRTSNSCSPPTARCAGPALRSASSSPARRCLRPRVRVVADEQLTGAPREAVEARLDALVKSHIEKLLGPLSQLAAAADVTGIARGVAFQLVEALGVLDRQRVAEEVKGLDQPARATLRKYGVRFGAYHIYLPQSAQARAARARRAALGAEKRQRRRSRASTICCTLPAPAAPRSRSIARSMPALYRTAGYRVCGERAVRVDILERLADLIRPALSWREGAPGPKPPARRRRRRLYRRQRHDVADRRVGRGFRLDPAFARLSHGPPAKAPRAAAGRGGDGAGRGSLRRRKPQLRRHRVEAAESSDGAAGAGR